MPTSASPPTRRCSPSCSSSAAWSATWAASIACRAIVGPAKAAELLFTGDPIDAHEAARIGLVREVVPHETLMSSARALAARIAINPPLALRYMKEGLRRGAYGDPREIGGWAIETIRRLMKHRGS